MSKTTASFVLPIGATVNMDGTSLYQAVACIFLAQFHLVDLTFAQQVTIVLTATLASIGRPPCPAQGSSCSSSCSARWASIPRIGIVYAIDRPLDMCRTVVNVTGDATVSSIVAHTQGEKLFER